MQNSFHVMTYKKYAHTFSTKTLLIYATQNVIEAKTESSLYQSYLKGKMGKHINGIYRFKMESIAPKARKRADEITHFVFFTEFGFDTMKRQCS